MRRRKDKEVINLENKEQVVAVVGATTDQKKYGYRVLMRLRELGFSNAVGINPKYKEVEGVRSYGSIAAMMAGLAAIKQDKVLVVTVVPPKITERVVEECGRLGIDKVWMQPGSESKRAVERAKELGIETMTACIVGEGLKEGWGSLRH